MNAELPQEFEPAPPKKWPFPLEVFRSIWLFFFHLTGWRIIGHLPNCRKHVMVGGPHTSNWDFMLFLTGVLYYRLRIQWMGKHTLFEGPFAWFMRATGGLAVDRRKASNTVEQMVEHINEHDDIVLVIAPEGTRGHTTELKSGFYHIAHGADVPITVALINSDEKTAGVVMTYNTTGDYDTDVAPIKKLYSETKGVRPEKSGLYQEQQKDK